MTATHKPKVSLVKKSMASAKKPIPFKAGASLDFELVDNGDTTCTVRGVDSAGNPVDISQVAHISVQSSDPSKVTVDPPAGLNFSMHAVGPLTLPGQPVVIAVTATWDDGSIGPFEFDLRVSTKAGPAGDIVVDIGDVTTH